MATIKDHCTEASVSAATVVIEPTVIVIITRTVVLQPVPDIFYSSCQPPVQFYDFSNTI